MEKERKDALEVAEEAKEAPPKVAEAQGRRAVNLFLRDARFLQIAIMAGS